MWQKNVQIDDAGVATACKSSDAIKNNLADALEKGQNLRNYINRSQLSGESIEALKAMIDLIVQLQKDVNGTFEKHVDAINQLSSDMADFPFNEEVTKIKNI